MSTMRISGLGSGFDVGGTIERLLEIEAKRIERIQEQQTRDNERIGAWIDLKESLSALSRAADTLRRMDVWRTMSSPSSHPHIVTATANSTAAKASYTISVTQLAHAHTIASAPNLSTSGGQPVAADTKLVEIDGIETGDQFVLGGQTITIKADDTLATLRNEINSAAENMPADARMTASILDNRLVLQRTKTGAETLNLSDLTGTPLLALGVLDSEGDPANELLAAQNALFSVNNALVERAANTGLTDVIEGVTLNFYDTGQSSLSIGQDTEAIKQAIFTFVEAYNEAAEKQEFYGQFDDTDPAMPIPGLLQGDSLMREINSKIRSQVTGLLFTHNASNAAYSFNGQEGVMNALHHIGIWTSSQSNRLEVVDEARLDAMLEQYPDKVEQLLRGIQTSNGRVNGIALNLYRTTRDYTSSLDGWIDMRIENIDDGIKQQDERIDRILREIEMKENMLWRQFGAMDEAIGRMQSGFEYLMGQIGSPSIGR